MSHDISLVVIAIVLEKLVDAIERYYLNRKNTKG